MPIDPDRYPPDWGEIATRIKDRASWQCDFCGVAHGAQGWRDALGYFHTSTAPVGEKTITIVLAAVHLGVDKPDGTPGDKNDTLDCRPENLAAACQRCHALLDVEQKARNRGLTLRFHLKRKGQLELWR